MIGHVEDRQIRLSVPFVTGAGRAVEIEFVIDTGYAGFLTLSTPAVVALGLPRRDTIRVILADNQAVFVDVCVATIVWHGVQRPVDVLAMGVRPLLGTSLLNGCEMTVRFMPNGDAIVLPLTAD